MEKSSKEKVNGGKAKSTLQLGIVEEGAAITGGAVRELAVFREEIEGGDIDAKGASDVEELCDTTAAVGRCTVAVPAMLFASPMQMYSSSIGDWNVCAACTSPIGVVSLSCHFC